MKIATFISAFVLYTSVFSSLFFLVDLVKKIKSLLIQGDTSVFNTINGCDDAFAACGYTFRRCTSCAGNDKSHFDEEVMLRPIIEAIHTHCVADHKHSQSTSESVDRGGGIKGEVAIKGTLTGKFSQLQEIVNQEEFNKFMDSLIKRKNENE